MNKNVIMRIKKKDFIRENITEFIDTDGNTIDGDESYETTSQVKTGVKDPESGVPAQTTDNFVKASRQGNRYYYGPNGFTYPAGSQSRTTAAAQLDDKSELGLNEDETDEIVETAKDKMAKMVEDIITKVKPKSDIVTTPRTSDVNKRKIPSIDEIRDIKPVVVNHTIEFVNALTFESLTSEEKVMITNHILENIDFSDISEYYKKLLKRKIS